MSERDSGRRAAPREWATFVTATALLWSVLWWMYSSPFRTTYFFLDEILYLRPKSFPVLGAFWMPFVFGLTNGRPISYFFWGIYLGLASNWNAMAWVRLIHFAFMCTGSALFLYVVARRSRSPWWALFVVVLLCAQPVIQVYFVITIASTYWFAAGFGCAAFLYLQRRRAALHDWRAARRPLLVSAALLMVAWMTFQPGPFCGLALASYYALSATPQDWREERRAVAAFSAVLIFTMVFYLVVYKLLLFATNAGTYGLVNPAFSTLTGGSIGTSSSFLNLTNYLGPFEWWNYPLPVEPLTDARFHLLTAATALVCVAVYLIAGSIEARAGERRLALERYGFGAVAILATFLPLVADGFSLRQHIYIGCVPAIVLAFAHSVSVVVSWMRPPRMVQVLLSAAAVAGLCVVVWGARAGFDSALVRPNALYYSFAREQVRRSADREFSRVVVVAPDPGCPREPCRGMHGYRMSFAAGGADADSYRKIVLDETGREEVEVKFFRGADAPENDPGGTVRIDYRELQRAASEVPLLDTTPPMPGETTRRRQPRIR